MSIDFHNMRVYWVTSIRHKIPFLKNKYIYTASSERSCMNNLSRKEAIEWAEHLRDTRHEVSMVAIISRSGIIMIDNIYD